MDDVFTWEQTYLNGQRRTTPVAAVVSGHTLFSPLSGRYVCPEAGALVSREREPHNREKLGTQFLKVRVTAMILSDQ